MKVLVACEFSGIVREAFTKNGHDAWSCDLLPTEIPGNHIQHDVLSVIANGWDLMIAHPRCTYLAISGARYFKDRQVEQELALQFVLKLMNAPISCICVENPVSIISTRVRKPDQIIQSYQFGHREKKRTCLWLKNLPPLQPTQLIKLLPGETYSNIGPSGNNKVGCKDRSKRRSRTYQGIAKAMADQWGTIK